MKFVICTITQAKAHGIEIIPSMRQSVDGTQVVLHEEYVRGIDEFNVLTRYEFDSPEFIEKMNGVEWTHGEDYVPPKEDFCKVMALQVLSDKVTREINTYELSDNESLVLKSFYPKWETFIGKSLEKDQKVLYKDNLYKVIQAVPSVVEGHTPDIVPANYALITEEHAGTKEDPIPYVQMMIIEKGKYYTQGGKLYIGLMDAPNGYPNDLKDLSTLVKEVID